ncbi:AAA family ATPase [Shimia ponticola]|uniref:AAA family ATPase n=1 Tax=Shimia ponticola TaxID=2582893 RepID=UPI0011BDE6B5|nr:hypothetical protein [Shimia ponticola]
MSAQKITLRHLSFHSPHKEPATIEFSSGFNLIYGASNTGKSSILDAIDFMLGRSSRKLKEIPQHIGYDEIFLGLEFSDGSTNTLSRSIDGGDFGLFVGLHTETPDGVEPLTLKAKQPTKKVESVSQFLLKKIGLHDKQLKKNADNQKERLTIRSLLPLFFVTETDIQKEISPFRSGQFTKETVETARLKLLLTGIDDSALKTSEKNEREAISRTARMGMLQELIQEVSEKIEAVAAEETSKEELEDQENRLIKTLERSNELLSGLEQDVLQIVEEKQSHQTDYEQNLRRLTEIKEMIERFDKLLLHYASDQDRLTGIIEAGSLISELESETCPLCGAAKEDQGFDHACNAETEEVVESAKAELGKIVKLENDLINTIDQLKLEAEDVGVSLANKRELVLRSNQRISELTPDLAQYRTRSAELHQKQAAVRRTIDLFEAREELEDKLNAIEEAPEKLEEASDNRVPTSSLFELADRVKSLLNSWHLPNTDQVHFDPEAVDIVLNGKHRISNGKGHRSITHAAMTLGLANYLNDKDLPTLGFVVLDSPLLAYEEPDEDDEISETHLNRHFFDGLEFSNDVQTIVFENKKSIPDDVEKYKNVTHFTKSRSFGRYGFFPVEPD